MQITSRHDNHTGLEQTRILFDDKGNYVCEIRWGNYFNFNPSQRRAEEGEKFLDELKKQIELLK